MTLPPFGPEVTPPATVGTQPRTASEVNALVGTHLREFVIAKNKVSQDHDFFLATDLKVEPYLFSADQETLIKSAVGNLDSDLDAIDMTFINRVIGMG